MFVGNDLEKITTKGRSPHFLRMTFLQKCFTESEMHYAKDEASLLHFYTKFWTQKEAVYKLLRQKNRIERSYNPLALVMNKLEHDLSVCEFESQQIYVKTSMSEHFAHSIAVEKMSHFETLVQIEEKCRLNKINGFPFVFFNGYWRMASKSNSGGREIVVTLVS